MNLVKTVHYIMFCGMWAFLCSPVHFGSESVFLSGFGSFLAVYLPIYCSYIYELVNREVVHGDSMRHFALYLVNK